MVERLGRENFDIAIIGGGINGAAIARDAALRGLKVALIDKGDFAGETSSRSSKLIHGGLRYLPQGQFHLVFEALRERERLRWHTAPHLVHPLRFLMPFYRGRRPGRIAIGFGLALYDLMARPARAERHRRLSREAAAMLEPMLRSDGLNGAATYYDCASDDARITLENALDAAYHGAAIANYAAAEALLHNGSALTAIGVRDRERDVSFELRARVFINAAGPWLEAIRRMDRADAAPCARLTKGVHLIVSRARLPITGPLVLTDGEGRIVFVIPLDANVLVGTTDTDFSGDPAEVAADAADLGYLLEVVNETLPAAALRPDDVLTAFAGLRVLAGEDPARSASRVAREELIEIAPSGLVTVAGGKLTTHRVIAEKVLRRVASRLGLGGAAAMTRELPLPGARRLAATTEALAGLPEHLQGALRSRYGTRVELVARIARDEPRFAAPILDDAALIAAEIIFAVRYEMARTVADFLIRRVALSWHDPDKAAAAAPVVARLMAAELGWDRRREAAEAGDFQPGIGRGRPVSP